MSFATGSHIEEHSVLRKQFLYFQPDNIDSWFNLQMIGDFVRISFDIITSNVLVFEV